MSHPVSATQSQSLKTAPLQEVFSSIQGEGVYVGKRQVFVRFAHCHLKCTYCDTPMTSPDGKCHVETEPGTGNTELIENPMRPETLVGVIEGLLKQGKHHSVSFTGGEPLLYHQFLKEVLPDVQRQCKTYLETSGTQPEFLATVLPWVDIIAMDIKLPSATGEAAYYDAHREFLKLASWASHTEVFIKLVFNNQTTDEELEAVKGIVTNRSLPIILQPVTDLTDRTVKVHPQRMLAIENTLAHHFDDVRLIPQTHKMLQVL